MYELMSAIKTRDVPTIIKLMTIASVPILMDMDGLGSTVTHFFARYNLPTCVDMMRDLYPQTLTKPNLLGITPNNLAAYSNQRGMVKKLDAFDDPIFRAAFYDEITDACSIEDAKKKDKAGKTALVYAFAAGHRKSVRILLQKLQKEDINRDELLNIIISNQHFHLLDEIVPYIGIVELERFFTRLEFVITQDGETNHETLMTRMNRCFDKPGDILQKITAFYKESPAELRQLYSTLIIVAAENFHLAFLRDLFQLWKGETKENKAVILHRSMSRLATALKNYQMINQLNINASKVIELIAAEYVIYFKDETSLHNNILVMLCTQGQFWAARIFSDEVSKLTPALGAVSTLHSKVEGELGDEAKHAIDRQRAGYRLYISSLAGCDSLKKAEWLEKQLIQSERFFKRLPEGVRVSYIQMFIADMWAALKKLLDTEANIEVIKIAYRRIIPLIEEKYIIKCPAREQLFNISDYIRSMRCGVLLGDYAHSINQISFILNSQPINDRLTHLFPGCVAQTQLSLLALLFIDNLNLQIPSVIKKNFFKGWDEELDSYMVGVFELPFSNPPVITQESLDNLMSKLSGYHYPKVKVSELTKSAAESFAFVSKTRVSANALCVFIKWLENIDAKIAPNIERDIKFIQQLRLKEDNISDIKLFLTFYEIKKICLNIFDHVFKEVNQAALLANVRIEVLAIESAYMAEVSNIIKILSRKIKTYELSIFPSYTPEFFAEFKTEENISKRKKSANKKQLKSEPEKEKKEGSVAEEEIVTSSEILPLVSNPESDTGGWITSTKPRKVEIAKVDVKPRPAPSIEPKQTLPLSTATSMLPVQQPVQSLAAVAEVPQQKIVTYLNFLPKEALEFLKELPGETLIVGGALRDAIQGKMPKDVDCVTTASIEEVFKKFPNAEEKSATHKMLQLNYKGLSIDLKCVQIKPGHTIFHFIAEDILERDFIINTLYHHPVFGLIDMLGAIPQLLLAKILHPPKMTKENTAFIDDPIRLLRGIRFRAKDKLQFSPYVAAGILKHKQEILEAMFIISPAKLEQEYTSYLAEFKTPMRVEGILKAFDKEFGDFGLYNLLLKRSIMVEAGELRFFPTRAHQSVTQTTVVEKRESPSSKANTGTS